jgi:hypothetical protein
MAKRRLAWQFLRLCFDRGSDFSAEQVAEAVGMTGERARAFMTQLNHLGRLERVWEGRTALTHRYRLLDASPLPLFKRKQPRKQPRVHQRIWNSVRILRMFTVAEVAATARASEITTRSYVRALERSRLLRVVSKEEGRVVYRLNLDAGSEPPQVQQSGVYAPGRAQLYPYREEA